MLHAFEATPRTLILGLYREFREGRSTHTELLGQLRLLETMLIRRALTDLDRSLDMIGVLCRSLVSGPKGIAQQLIRRTPEDPAIRLALAHGRLPHADFVLQRLQRVPDMHDMQVEHIHPQTPPPRWSGGGSTAWGDLDTHAQAEYRTLLNTIGNLTLLEASYNQRASNRSFPDNGHDPV